MKSNCPICKNKVIYFYQKEYIIFPIIDNERSNKFYPCCSKECFSKFIKVKK